MASLDWGTYEVTSVYYDHQLNLGFSLNNLPKNTQPIDFLGKYLCIEVKTMDNSPAKSLSLYLRNPCRHCLTETILGTHIDPLQESHRF